MERDYSAKAFFEFMDYLSAKGLLNQNTATSRKAASKKILDILESEEKKDLRKIDVDALHNRFANLSRNTYTPQSLQVYKSRFASARKDFIKFVDNPSGFRPTVAQREPPSGNKAFKRAPESAMKSETTSYQPSGFREPLVFPVPIRSDVTIEIRNLPVDFTEAEAERVAAVVKALAKK